MSRFQLVGFVLSLVSLVLACGCADDLRGKNLFDAGAGDAFLRFSVENISLSRAEDELDVESLIDHAYLLFYSKDASVLTANPLAAVNATVEESNPTALAFKMPLSLQADTDYQLVAIANADSYVPDGFSTFAEYLQSWSGSPVEGRGMLSLYHADCIHASADSPLPMRGVLNGGSYFRFSMQNGESRISSSLSFRRSVARIDVANIVKEGFKIEGVALCNWRDAASAVSEESDLGNRFGSVRGVLSDEDSPTLEYETMPDADDNGIQRLQKAIYSFPSVSYDSYAADKESTALIIKANFGQDTESTYYRVNVGASGNKAEIRSNTKYLVTIQSVKGSGAPTAQEAYAAEESPIVLSVVEDWDLDVGSFAMDDKGNFIVLSTGHLEFAGDVVENREIRVLTTKGLTWTVAPDSEETSSAFNVSNLSNVSLAIGPKGKNESDDNLTGKFIVTATTPDGGTLTVNIHVEQLPASEQPDDPTIIPDDMPFALIPTEESKDRVKINHEKKTIEIDGFDPGCFNSFIDVPFKVYIKDSSLNSVNISTTLQWPLEGRVSEDKIKYFYCQQSFNAYPTGQVKNEADKLVVYGDIVKGPISASDANEVYISVGAMGPDDPAITGRTVTMQALNGESVVYNLTLKPRPCIIDDVILSDGTGNFWLIQDRNIQDYKSGKTGLNFTEFVGLDSYGKKRQAYNYTEIGNFQNYSFTIPFKYSKESESFSEIMHELYLGKLTNYSSRSTLNGNENTEGSRLNWLKRYKYSNGSQGASPFYEDIENNYNYKYWVFPSEYVIEICRKNLHVSKMRMFFVSEFSVQTGKVAIPVCCYLSYKCFNLGDHSGGCTGFFASTDSYTPNSLIVMYFDNKEGITVKATTSGSTGLSRLVRPLTNEELEMYKTNYLGYGSVPHKLTICHPDTYESTPLGWLPY